MTIEALTPAEKNARYRARRDLWDRVTKPEMEVTAENFAATRRDVPLFGTPIINPLLTLPMMLTAQGQRP